VGLRWRGGSAAFGDLGALGCAANLGELDVTPEVERAREQSRVFLLAARRCNEFQPPSGYLQFLFVPSLVLYAFAIEVGFKVQHPIDTDLGFMQRLARAVEKALAAMT